eukprot:3907425-Amphidinium_carterae.1
MTHTWDGVISDSRLGQNLDQRMCMSQFQCNPFQRVIIQVVSKRPFQIPLVGIRPDKNPSHKS